MNPEYPQLTDPFTGDLDEFSLDFSLAGYPGNFCFRKSLIPHKGGGGGGGANDRGDVKGVEVTLTPEGWQALREEAGRRMTAEELTEAIRIVEAVIDLIGGFTKEEAAQIVAAYRRGFNSRF